MKTKMIYTAKELLLKLTHLTLVGQDSFGELEWQGTEKEWQLAENEKPNI